MPLVEKSQKSFRGDFRQYQRARKKLRQLERNGNWPNTLLAVFIFKNVA